MPFQINQAAYEASVHGLINRCVREREYLADYPINIFAKQPCGEWIAAGLGFNPLVDPKTGCKYPDERFRPFFTVQQHDGWFEMIVKLGHPDMPAIVVLFLEDCDGCDPVLRAMCCQFAAPAELWKAENLEDCAGSSGTTHQ